MLRMLIEQLKRRLEVLPLTQFRLSFSKLRKCVVFRSANRRQPVYDWLCQQESPAGELGFLIDGKMDDWWQYGESYGIASIG